MAHRGAFLRGYKWDDLTEAEKAALSDVVSIASTRAAVGVGVVLTAAALVSSGMYSHSDHPSANF